MRRKTLLTRKGHHAFCAITLSRAFWIQPSLHEIAAKTSLISQSKAL
jgi:hypothetical protein